MSLSKEIVTTTINVKRAEAETKTQSLEKLGLKELCSSVELAFFKRGGREPGVHKWGR
jgi:hypothetical protein